jgi:hypothetical protein
VSSNEPLAVEGALVIGYLALGLGVLAAYSSPAEGYELSIYGATPVAFWVALFVVAVVSVSVSLYDRRYLPLAVLLGGLGAAAVAGLPLIRGYYFYGRADSLVHLGWVRSINVGNNPLALFYPGSHLIAASVSKVAGIQVTRAMMLVVWASVLLFYMAVSLCVWFLVPDRRALAAGAFSAFLLLPVTNVSTYLHFHTYSFAMLFVPLVLYFLFTHLIGGEPREGVVKRVGDGGGTVSRSSPGFGSETALGVGPINTVPTSYLLPVASVALVLFHPQMALNVLILLGGITITQHLFRLFRPQHQIAEYRLLTFQTALLVLIFVAWVTTHDWQFVNTAETMVESINNFIAGTASTTPRVESQSDSAEAIGTSIWELFVKLFGVGAVYSLLAAGVVLGRVSGLLDRLNTGQSFRSTPDTARGVITLTFAGILALLPFYAAQLVGSISTYLFRYVGFLMVLATIFGAVGVRYLLWDDSDGGDRDRRSAGTRLKSVRRLAARVPDGRSILTVAVVLLLLSLSLATAFPSPFVSLPGSHVPEGEMDGYEQAFASQPAGSPVWFGGVRTTSDRYEVALYGAESAPWEREVSPSPKKSSPVPQEAMLNGLPMFYANHPEKIVQRDHYFVVSEADRQREVDAYEELRYSAASFEAVEATPDVGKVRDNGELTVYFVDIEADTAANTTDSGG